MTVAPVFNAVTTNPPTEEDYALAAAELAEAIAAAGDDWAAVQEQFPYYDSEGKSVFAHQRNMLRILMRESELTELITGYGFVMDVFYHGEPGQVYGPYANKCRFHQWGQGPGVWAIKVISYDRAGQLPPFKDLNSGRNYELAYEDFLNLTFSDWLQLQLADYAAQYVES